MIIPPLWGIPVVLVVGIAVVWYGWWADRRATARATAGYTPQSEIDAATPGHAPDAEHLLAVVARLSDAVSVPTDAAGTVLTASVPPGHVGPPSLEGRIAVAEHPLVLLADADLNDPVALVPALRHARDEDRPLVLVARTLGAAVLDTLDANARTGRIITVPLTASSAVIAQLSELTCALPLTEQDWRAGWLPSGAWGSAEAWVADAQRSWIVLPA